MGEPWWSGPFRELRVDRHADGVVVLTLDLPDRRNMMSEAMTTSWQRAIEGIAGDADARAVVVTGAGSSFCSGGDLSWIESEPDASVARLRSRMVVFYRTWLAIIDLEVPTIAAVNGPAVGAGMALALACDLRFVALEARLSVPFTRLGLHPGMGTTWSLAKVAGPAVARDLLLTGRAVDGEEAVRLGLASRALPGERVLHAAMDAAGSIARCAPVATRLTKVALADGGHSDVDAALEWEALAQAVTLTTADMREGIAAQRERRRPLFTGT